jgi:hypothetical protein
MNDQSIPHPKDTSLALLFWRVALIALSLLTLAYGLWVSSHWERATPARAGTLAATFGPPNADSRRPILALAADSPLAQAGARIGDAVKFDRTVMSQLGTDEHVGLTLFSAGRASRWSLQPIPDPEIMAHGSAAQVRAVFDLVAAFLALVIALLIGLRRGDSIAMRVFAMSLLLGTGMDGFNFYVPNSALTDVTFPFLRAMGYSCGYVLFTLFTLIYPEDRPLWRLRWVRYAFYVFLIGFAVQTPLRILHLSGSLPAFFAAPGVADIYRSLSQILSIVSPLASLAALSFTWARSTGDVRQRLGWIGASIGAIYVLWVVGNLNDMLGNPISYLAMQAPISVVSLLALIGFGYALLRHRLFDFGFAVNRALVVTIISTLLLVLFSITEWGVDKLLHFEGREKNVVFDALVALGVILSFHRIQHWVSHQVDHIFFHHWYQAAESLRRFFDMAAHISETAALQAKFAQAATEFSGASGVALYALDAGGNFARTYSTLADAPASIDANHDVAIELRHSHRVADLAERTGLPCELAFPMTVRGRVEGMVLLGQRRNGKPYRPDQVALLATGVHQVGMDLESLRVIELEQGMAQLKQKMELVECEAQTLRRVVGLRLAAAAS